ncbi:formate dehydrogenase accessory sulfurtransferase FdhD [Methylophaga sp. OBS3]|uniref:formate dehydrogenase accessory sulfurtransferase FdhD n=1 Tax=Methylophaga sp. OBS3 TaxID=2991934 RepID=UPI0022548030|nr:formate dehydrogenase accessory sulfurtransferase FdhD [Methylophaga sp. OBS3]MCX4190571.1 formate dehydrogenase accessory sulfurtransferase FdhD [Methylophaga sp. OBS3]
MAKPTRHENMADNSVMRNLPAVSVNKIVNARHNDKPFVEVMTDDIATEIPVALVYNCVSHAVMMASPSDLEDFAYGFSLSEEIVKNVDEIESVHVLQNEQGITLRVRIHEERFAELKQRRNLVGRTGCGLCGTETLKQAIRPVPQVIAPDLSAEVIEHALSALRSQQPINALTGATHAAAWCDLSGQILVCREDVGRHNALDKLIGHLQRQQVDVSQGFVLVSSRASYEMVQKTCQAGIGALVAISAPTSLAIDMAQQADLLLVGFARNQRHIIYHQPLTAAERLQQAI